jgi:hypothetical protein
MEITARAICGLRATELMFVEAARRNQTARQVPNPLITPAFIRELVALGGYSEATGGAIEKIMNRERGEPKVSELDRVVRVFTERWKGKLQYDRMSHKWMEHVDGGWKVDQTRKAFNAIVETSRELNHKGKRGMASAQFCVRVRRHLQKSPEFEVFLPRVKGRGRVS